MNKPKCIRGHDSKFMILKNNFWMCYAPTPEDDIFDICMYHPPRSQGNRKSVYRKRRFNCIQCGVKTSGHIRCPKHEKIHLKEYNMTYKQQQREFKREQRKA
jgi:hypothetical protein